MIPAPGIRHPEPCNRRMMTGAGTREPGAGSLWPAAGPPGPGRFQTCCRASGPGWLFPSKNAAGPLGSGCMNGRRPCGPAPRAGRFKTDATPRVACFLRWRYSYISVCMKKFDKIPSIPLIEEWSSHPITTEISGPGASISVNTTRKTKTRLTVNGKLRRRLTQKK